jgi:hypothetical protein
MFELEIELVQNKTNKNLATRVHNTGGGVTRIIL